MIIEKDLTNVYRSVYKFLSETAYTKDADTEILSQHFSGLNILSEYPQDLMILSLPSIALSAPEEGGVEDPYFGDAYAYRYEFSIYGFAGGKTDDADNILLRDEMRNDIKRLLEGSSIPIWSFPDLTVLGNMEVLDVTSRHLPPISQTIAADRFKFVVDFAIILEGR